MMAHKHRTTTAKRKVDGTKNNGVYAISIAKPGGYNVLCVRDIGQPTRGSNCLRQPPVGQPTQLFEEIDEDNMVTVDVAFCGVNYADVCIRWGLYSSARKYNGYPIVPGKSLTACGAPV